MIANVKRLRDHDNGGDNADDANEAAADDDAEN